MSFQNCKIVQVGADPTEYHKQVAKRGEAGFVVSSSPLRDFIHCPRRWINGYESSDSKSTDWGSLIDCRFLTPDQFGARVAIQPPTYTNEKGEVKDWSNNAKKCKEWNEFHREAGHQIASVEDVNECDKAIQRLMDDPTIARWHSDSDRQVWVAGEWKDEATGIVVPCKCLLDYVPRASSEYFRCLGDFKSARSAAPRGWSRHLYTYGYHIQGALNLDMFVAATQEDRQTWCWILQENYPPYEPGLEMMSEDFMAMGRATYQQAMGRYCRCLKSGQWPGYDAMNPDNLQGWSLAVPEVWMAFVEMSCSMEAQVDAEDAAKDDVPENDITP
mgnify:CR=1 FL=1